MSVVLNILSEFDGSGIEKAKKQFSQLETSGQKAQFALKKAAVPAAIAVAGIGAALVDATKSAMEDAAAQVVLAGNLKNSAHATDAQVKSTEAMILKMSMATGVADDVLRPAMSKLVLATNDVERSNKLLAIAQDVSAATGKPLETVTQALAKAEMGQYAALKKLGIPMSDGIQASIDLQKEQKKLAKEEQALALVKYQIAEGMLKGSDATKALTKEQEKFASQSQIVNDLMATTGDYADDVAKKFGGAAADAAGTAEGQFKRLGVALAETKESIGAALLPAIEAVLPFLQKIGAWAQEHSTIFLVVAGVIGGLALAIVGVNTAMTIWAATTKAFAAIQTAFNAIMDANPFVLVGLAVVALVAGLVILYKNFEPFRKIVDSIFGAIKFWISEVIVPEFKNLLGVAKTIFNGIATIWNNTFGKLSFSIPSWIPGIGGKGFDVPNIPLMADGGIVTSPTLAMIGEAGPEAVIPLGRGGAMGGNNVTINVNGGDPNAVVDALRRYMRQNGSIPMRTANIY